VAGVRVAEVASGPVGFANWGTQQVVAVDILGKSEIMAHIPTSLPYSIDWLPDGRVLVVSGQEALLLRQEPDGALATHADLSGIDRGFTRSSWTSVEAPTSTAAAST
jgi:hypothetical protein